MSLPNIPNIEPNITLNSCHSINLLISSIAMEEIALSHILNAEGEKLQRFVKNHPLKAEQFFEMNKQVNDLLRSIVKSQLLLQLKLEEVSTIIDSDLLKKCQSKRKCQHCRYCIHCQKPLCHNQPCKCYQANNYKR